MNFFQKYYAVFILFYATGFYACGDKEALFRAVPSSRSGIDFVNRVDENDTVNVLEYMNVYTGAGVAAGDVNNDGLTDLYFSSNRNGGRLYVNRGNLKFEDVTEKAGFINDRWETGVAMSDVNQDGWLDIYVNVAGSASFGKLANLLYINNGNGTFSEKAAQYGLADERLTMNSSFFDYDKDGDLDVFLITNPADERVTGINNITERQLNGESKGTDILYRNNGDGTFTDVSRVAGILIDGYSLGAAISDVNGDDWPDIFISNDFLTSDILYINNGDGTFTDRISEQLKHSSFASMGNDVADFNNDCLPDIFVLDMLPEDNYRRKMIVPASSYDRFQLAIEKGYHPQYSRNTLQLNNGNGTFSEVSFLAGVSSTDWSWSALWGDYDNDGDKDMMVTNGFYRDLGNLDYINYQARLQNPMGTRDAKKQLKLEAIRKLPMIPLQNYLFENQGKLSFAKRSDEWGFTEKGFSNGACYADLDNDGDLELVTNDFNGEAKLYENRASDLVKNAYVRITLKGKKPNVQGIGAKVWMHIGTDEQYLELYPQRGFESSVEPVLHFGAGKASMADSVVVVWPDGNRQVLKQLSLNRPVTISYEQASSHDRLAFKQTSNQLFTKLDSTSGINYNHRENEFVDFKVQPLLPSMHSRNGPGVCVGDINGDNLEDFYVGAPLGSTGEFFMQRQDGSFTKKALDGGEQFEDMGVLFFDADKDADLDLYVVSGGSEQNDGTRGLQDRLYINDGRGNFRHAPELLPDTRSSGSCVVGADYDHDGDLDLFVGGRVVPGSYPSLPKSYLLRNDGGKFQDVSAAQLPAAGKIGMITSALWSDHDNDSWADLVLVGEFMPLTIVKNNQGSLKPADVIQVPGASGWWNSLAAGDFDEDGDIDYIGGNLGLNSRFRASPDQPLCVYAKDFDKNGRIDPVICYYVDGENYIHPTRDELIRQINSMRRRFETYESYASATFKQSFTAEEIGDAQVLKMECTETSYFENQGGGKFSRKALPIEAQFAPVYGILTGDYNSDGHTDLLLAGNSYASEASTGRYDALTGLVLAGDAKGTFAVVPATATGWLASGDVKGLANLRNERGNIVLVANNHQPLEASLWQGSERKVLMPRAGESYAIIKKKNGRTIRQEFYWGSSYLSQSSRVVTLSFEPESVTYYNVNNSQRSE